MDDDGVQYSGHTTTAETRQPRAQRNVKIEIHCESISCARGSRVQTFIGAIHYSSVHQQIRNKTPSAR